jgi:hypothetical protein
LSEIERAIKLIALSFSNVFRKDYDDETGTAIIRTLSIMRIESFAKASETQ